MRKNEKSIPEAMATVKQLEAMTIRRRKLLIVCDNGMISRDLLLWVFKSFAILLKTMQGGRGMKVSRFVSKRFKETPADCQIESQALMIRGGYIKAVGNGIYTLLPIAKRIVRKIEGILREEMDRIGGQEVLFPVTMPAALWQASGRFESVGEELLRFRDRSGGDMVLGMTHEEAAVHLMKDIADSYTQYPLMIYQIQTKFRDEPRARGGLIRVREFTMKDGYSFHTSQEDLSAYYDRCYEAYRRIFARVGIPEVIPIQSDSGMMGGKVAHEFMLVTDVGEDSLVLCGACEFKSNMESAACVIRNEPGQERPLRKISTPGIKTIEDLSRFLSLPASQILKAVLYTQGGTGELVAVFLRGDLEVNETKLRNLLKTQVFPAAEEVDSPLAMGFVGPLGLPKGIRMIMDRSIQGIGGVVTGANEADAHFAGFQVERDLGPVAYEDVAKTYEGAICPQCGHAALRIARGIEVGNIFQLGGRYSVAMGMRYLDEAGVLRHPLMGCYGIGVGRLMASVCEARRDRFGPIWPMSIAPWQVQLCSLRPEDERVQRASQALYDDLSTRGLETLWDDRPVSAGVMFSDADLFGVPIRAVISPKGMNAGMVELSARDKSFSERVPVTEAGERIASMVRAAQEALCGEWEI